MTNTAHEITTDCAWTCASCDAPIRCYHLTDLCPACLADCSSVGPSGCSDYDDACDAIVTREQARREIGRHDGPGDCAAHGMDGHSTAWSAFLCDCGSRDTYRGREVLDWLGY